jgi:hypothetical protein
MILLTVYYLENSSKKSARTRKTLVDEKICYCLRPQYIRRGVYKEKLYGQKSKFCAENGLKMILLTVCYLENSLENSARTRKTFVVRKISYSLRTQYI